MVGLQYDCLANPAGAVRLRFEKAMASGDGQVALTGKDWGTGKIFADFISENLLQIPILNQATARSLKPNALVRFRGMVQDILGAEFYTGAFKDGPVWRTNKFMDASLCHIPFNCSDFDVASSPDIRIWECHLVYCVPKYFLDADDGSNDDGRDESEPGNMDGDEIIRPKKKKRVTRVELNKRARRKEVLKIEAGTKKLKVLAKEIDSLSNIIEEMEEENKEKEKRRIRRVVAKQERLKVCPPHLGKRKFEPAPTQVLLSEAITGSLRKLKACCTLARDRFKSFEKRGLIVPTARSSRRK